MLVKLQKFDFLWILILSLFISGCEKNTDIFTKAEYDYSTKAVVIIVIDGPRFSETWGINGPSHIPHQLELAKSGSVVRNFFNEEVTFTLSGHSAITTGHYGLVSNDGTELPDHHSIFQEFLKSTQLSPVKAWIITSKSKLAALQDTKEMGWRGSYLPSIDTQQRPDIQTLNSAKTIFTQHHPLLTMIHFREPDSYGHANDWDNYIKSIESTDDYVNQLWEFLQYDPFYAGSTTLIVTNDHGRHLDGINTGFVGHGDNCEGCRRISFLALGPDIKINHSVTAPYGQVDIAPTVGELLGFDWTGEGSVIREILN